jgi:hypothetical protein
MKITGGTGDLGVFNLGKGNNISGSTAGFTFVGDGYAGGGGNTIGGGASSASGTIFGFTFPAGTVIIGGNGDVINGANGTMLVNALNGGQTVNGGLGAATVWAGPGGAVNGGPGAMQFNVGGGTKVTGGTGPLNAFFLFPGNTITGGSSTNVINDAYGVGGNSSLIGGIGSSTIFGGTGDTIQGGTGTLEAKIFLGFGPETVNLGSGVAGVRDVPSVAGGGTGGTPVTVTGFANNAANVIETPNFDGTKFTGTSSSSAAGTLLTFTDGNTMLIAGVASVGAIKFTN